MIANDHSARALAVVEQARRADRVYAGVVLGLEGGYLGACGRKVGYGVIDQHLVMGYQIADDSVPTGESVFAIDDDISA